VFADYYFCFCFCSNTYGSINEKNRSFFSSFRTKVRFSTTLSNKKRYDHSSIIIAVLSFQNRVPVNQCWFNNGTVPIITTCKTGNDGALLKKLLAIMYHEYLCLKRISVI
jgi:hypothetical protein